MSKNIYEEKEKHYTVKKRKLKYGALFCIIIIPACLLLILGYILLDKSITKENTNNISYEEIGTVDYKVYLKDNDYYSSSYLESGMQYIASLIKTINVDFAYKIKTTEELDYDYTYKIDAKLVITDKSDNKKVLYERPEELLKETNVKLINDELNILEDIDIDYNVYNDYVNSFKSDYALTVDSNLIITLTVNAKGVTGNDEFNKNQELSISIPLSEQTVDIEITTDDIDEAGVINSEIIVSKVNNYILLIIGIILEILSLGLFVVAIYILLSKNSKDIYKMEVNRILKNYDRLIVTSKRPDIDETKFENKIRVMSIEELIDVNLNTKQPIIYYEVIPNEKSYFVIITDKTIYKLTISRAWLEKQKKIGK